MMASGSMSKIHLGMYALQFMGEFNNMIKQFKNKDRKMTYISSSMSQLELLLEFTFANLNEEVEPLIYFFEAVKALLKLKEYVSLITKERMGCYVSKELYEVHKQVEEKKKSMVMLPRSGKSIPKPDNFPISSKMKQYALKSVNSIDSLQSLDDQMMIGNPARFSNILVKNESEAQKKSLAGTIYSFIWKKFKYFKKLLGSRKLKISEVMLILRPLIYMYLLLRYGQNSYKPFLASLAIEIYGILIGWHKMSKCKTETEKEELRGRWKGLFKYLLKEPFYSKYTVRIVYLMLYKFISASKISMILSLLTYFKYYTYIV